MTYCAGNCSAESADSTRRPVSALQDADRDRQVAHKTRRVVMASLGVLQDQKTRRKRNISLALAAMVLVVLALGPLVWIVEEFITSGGHLGDMSTELSLWVCILVPAVLAAALVAGWLRRR